MSRGPEHTDLRARTRGRSSWLLALGVSLLVVGLVLFVVAQNQSQNRSGGATAPRTPGAAASSPSSSASSPSKTGARATKPPRTQAPAQRPVRDPAAGVPVRLAVPAIGVHAQVVPVRMQPGGVLWPPYPTRAGWWAGGAKPGAAYGSALIVGHTVHTGGGVFDDLGRVRAGERVRVTTRNGTIRYVVTAVRTYAKSGFAARAQRIFSQDVAGRLVLVTCGDWTGKDYLTNIVVTAEPATRPGS